MMALLYLVAILVVGDTVARPLLSATAAADRPRRLATAILAGFLPLTWLTYAAAYLLRDRAGSLDIADGIALGVGAAVLVGRIGWWLARGRSRSPLFDRPGRPEALDWVLVAGMTVFVGWMMSQTYFFQDGQLHISGIVWSDFGPTTAISQSFALGANFPTEYPHFADFPILYHFLFYFAAGNLTRLGFDPALALNVYSTATMIAMLILVVAIGRALFRSGTVGRIAALLFFVHGSLSWIPYVLGFASPTDALQAIWTKTGPLVSGFPYRGEEWGIWTQGTFLNQRHLAGAIGIVLLGVLFVIERYNDWRAGQVAARTEEDEEVAAQTRQRLAWVTGGSSTVLAASGPAPLAAAAGSAPSAAAAPAAGGSIAPAGTAGARPHRSRLATLDAMAVELRDRTAHPLRHIANGLVDRWLLGYVLVGFLLGMLPMWNSAVFLAAAGVFAVLFLLLPNRAQLVATAIAAGSIALPQLLALRPAGLPNAGDYPAIHWGYTVDPPTVANVAAYLAFTFGPKVALALVALIAASRLQLAVFLAFTALVGVAFGFQFSPEVFANHKFLNVWLIALNVFAAAGLLRLWFLGASVAARLGPGLRTQLAERLGPALRAGAAIAGRAAVAVLVVVIATGGVIDLMEIKNTGSVAIRLQGDRLFDWLLADTRPDDVFLTDLYVTHPILLAGRKIYYGWPYYAWSAGYPVGPREQSYKDILGSTDAAEAVRLLQQAKIAYVAIDDGMRSRNFVPFLNEPLLASALQAVFTDPDNTYQHLVIYRVPSQPPTDGATSPGAPLAAGAPSTGPVSMLAGGRGSGPGEFVDPRGIAIAPNGEVLVADSGNNRIERFAAGGAYLSSYGGLGDQAGRFNQPNGVAVDSRGHSFVADTLNHRVQELDASSSFVRSWTGPDPGFYGPRDIAIGPDDSVYVLDQGHARVVRLAPDGKVTTFGTFGAGPGQLNDPSGLAVAGEQVYVADPTNSRVQVFGIDGAFGRSIAVPEWSKATGTADVAVSSDRMRLYASSPGTNAVLVLPLSPAGTRETLQPSGGAALARPSALAVRPDGQVLVVSFEASRVVLLPAPGP